MVRKALLAVIASSFAVAAVVLPQTSASAATCSGTGCDNKPPGSYGCSADAITAEQANIYDPVNTAARVGYLQLRYSPSCRTVWAKIVGFVQPDTDFYDDFAHVQNNYTGDYLECSSAGTSYNSTYGGWACQTNMLYDGGETSYAQGDVVGDNSIGAPPGVVETGSY